jgi:hypothetical protein
VERIRENGDEWCWLSLRVKMLATVRLLLRGIRW